MLLPLFDLGSEDLIFLILPDSRSCKDFLQGNNSYKLQLKLLRNKIQKICRLVNEHVEALLVKNIIMDSLTFENIIEMLPREDVLFRHILPLVTPEDW